MDINKARVICKAIDKMVKRGEHFNWCGLTHISKEAKLNRQTTWRYLNALFVDGKVSKIERTWRGAVCYRYYLTQEGKEFLASFQELPGLESVTK